MYGTLERKLEQNFDKNRSRYRMTSGSTRVLFIIVFNPVQADTDINWFEYRHQFCSFLYRRTLGIFRCINTLGYITRRASLYNSDLFDELLLWVHCAFPALLIYYWRYNQLPLSSYFVVLTAAFLIILVVNRSELETVSFRERTGKRCTLYSCTCTPRSP